jgi:hypothetical protein
MGELRMRRAGLQGGPALLCNYKVNFLINRKARNQFPKEKIC